jgi:hypothetical protein
MSRTLSNTLKTKFYFGAELVDLIKEKNKDLLDQIIHCYVSVFNESWSEKWDFESASREIIESFSMDSNRIPLAVFLFDQSKVVGFAWAVITTDDYISAKKDMPFPVSMPEKNDGISVLKFWLNIWNKKKILIFREMGVLKSYRGGHAISLFYPIIRCANKHGCNYINYWTSSKSPTFTMGLSISFYAIDTQYFVAWT